MAGIQEKQLVQLRENSTTATSIYSPGTGVTAIIKTIIVCNQTASSATYRIFLDNDGTTYGNETALFFDVPIGANETDLIETYLPMANDAGNIAGRTNIANAITFTVAGAEIT